ncbi:MAG: aminotransferase class III-fold pyridoxal phosphate-dependent enzyme, partial [Gemmatimonadales bacterium]
MSDAVAGFTSTGSKRPEALFGGTATGVPRVMVRSEGCRVWDVDGREYLDLVMALGAVALGYAEPRVTEAAIAAVRDGVVGPLPPVLEEEVAAELRRLIPWVERVRFL